MLTKDMPVLIKAGPDDGLGEGQFTAYASVFGNVDSYGDVVVRGAFDADLKRWEASGNPIPLLFGHNMSDPDYNIGHVMSAVEDAKGLLVTAQLDLENPKAMQTYRMLKGKRINQMSFAYDTITSAPGKVDGHDVNDLLELKVYEVSVVTIGANQETEILAVKSATDAMMAKAGRVLSAKNEATLRDAHEQLTAAASQVKTVLSALDSADDGSKATAEEPVTADTHASVKAEPMPEATAQLTKSLLLELDAIGV